MSPRRPGAALLAVVALAAAGCGTDTKAENAYVDDVQRAQTAYVTRFDQSLARLTATSTLAQDRATLGQFAQITDRFGTTLQQLEPPSKVAAEHRALVAAVVAVREQFVRGRARLSGGTSRDRAVVRTQLSSAVDANQARFTKAIAAINAALHD
jgi:hypothetical protein